MGEPIKGSIHGYDELVGNASIGPTNNEEQEDTRTPTTTIRPLDDSYQKRIEGLKEALLAMKKKNKILQDTILQLKGELDDLGGMCAKSTANLFSIGEQLRSLTRQYKKDTSEFQTSPLQEYIDRACNKMGPFPQRAKEVWVEVEGAESSHLILQVGQNKATGWQYMSMVQHRHGGVVPCLDTFTHGPCQGMD